MSDPVRDRAETIKAQMITEFEKKIRSVISHPHTSKILAEELADEGMFYVEKVLEEMAIMEDVEVQ